MENEATMKGYIGSSSGKREATATAAKSLKFAFLIHPLTADDLGRRGAGMVAGTTKSIFGRRFGRWLVKRFGINEQWGMKHLPNELIEKCLPYLPGRLGYTVCSKFNAQEKAVGYIVATLLTGRQFKKLSREKVQIRVLKNILFCQNVLGANVVGLGAYNAPALLIKEIGKTIFEASEKELETALSQKVLRLVKKVTCRITDGDSLSSIAAIPAIYQGLKIRNIRAKQLGFSELDFSDATCCVVGATGVVGGGLVRLLVSLKKPPKELRLTCHSRKDELKKLKEELVSKGYNGKIYLNIKLSDKGEEVIERITKCVHGSDIVVTCTTGIGDIIIPSMIDKEQPVVMVDMARPINISQKLLDKCPRSIHIDGGIINIGDVDTRFDMGAGVVRNETFACLTQTMAEALTGLGKGGHSVGAVDPPYAIKLWEVIKQLGFHVASPKSFKRSYDKSGHLIFEGGSGFPPYEKSSKVRSFRPPTTKVNLLKT